MLSYLRPHDPCFVGCFVGATRIALGLSQICFFRLEVSMAVVRGPGWDGNDHPSTVPPNPESVTCPNVALRQVGIITAISTFMAIRVTSAGGKDS